MVVFKAISEILGNRRTVLVQNASRDESLRSWNQRGKYHDVIARSRSVIQNVSFLSRGSQKSNWSRVSRENHSFCVASTMFDEVVGW